MMAMLMKRSRVLILPLVVLMLWAVFPNHSALGVLIGTDAAMQAADGARARAYLHSVLAREEVQKALKARGIDSLEAAARVDGLTDAEAVDFARQLEQLPAGQGGGAWGIVGIAVVVVFIILLITDWLGYTDVFNF